jgi:hypothetical protein
MIYFVCTLDSARGWLQNRSCWSWGCWICSPCFWNPLQISCGPERPLSSKRTAAYTRFGPKLGARAESTGILATIPYRLLFCVFASPPFLIYLSYWLSNSHKIWRIYMDQNFKSSAQEGMKGHYESGGWASLGFASRCDLWSRFDEDEEPSTSIYLKFQSPHPDSTVNCQGGDSSILNNFYWL